MGKEAGAEGRTSTGQVPCPGCAVSLSQLSELSLVTDVDSEGPALQALHSTDSICPEVAFRVSFN